MWTDCICHVGSSWDYRFVPEGELLAGGVATQEGRQTCFFTAVNLLSNSILTPRLEEGAKNDSLQIDMEKGAQCSLLARYKKLAKDEGLVFWETVSNFIILYESMPADCLVKVVRRNRNDTDEEILDQGETPAPREAPRVVLKRAPFAWRDPSRNLPQDDVARSTPIRLVPKVDQTSYGVTQAQVRET